MGAGCGRSCQATDEKELADAAGRDRELAFVAPAVGGLEVDALGKCPLTKVHQSVV